MEREGEQPAHTERALRGAPTIEYLHVSYRAREVGQLAARWPLADAAPACGLAVGDGLPV